MLRDTATGIPYRRRASALRVAALAAVILLVASPVMADESAETALAAVEQRLLTATRVNFRFDIRAVGAVDAALTGTASIGPGQQAQIAAEGSFAGSAATIVLVADGQAMQGGNGDLLFEADTPPALREGMVIGLVRMGLLHNLAVLSGGAPPDRTDGTIRDWVRYTDVTIEPEDDIGGVATRRFRFTVVVGGQPSAIAELWVNAETGLPVRRVQVVNFDQGEMRVLEQYPEFSIDEGG